jgi:hypothetical protein
MRSLSAHIRRPLSSSVTTSRCRWLYAIGDLSWSARPTTAGPADQVQLAAEATPGTTQGVPAGFSRTAPNLQRLSGRRIGVIRRCACVLVRAGGDHPAGTRGVLVRPVDRRVTCVIRAPCWWSMRPGMSRRAPPRSGSSGSTPGAYAGQVGHAMIDRELCLPKPRTTGPVHCGRRARRRRPSPFPPR